MSEILDKEQNQEVKDLFEETFGNEAKQELEKKEKKLKTLKFQHNPDAEESEFDDLGEQKDELNFAFMTKLAEDTSHLQGYDLMDKDLGLVGENYNPVKKGLWYYQNSLRQEVVNYKLNHKTKVDNRTHLCIFTSPGSGKTTIKNQNKRILKDFEETEGQIEVAGVSHPEQLVGKIKYEGSGKNKKPVTKWGILAYNCVMNDEAQTLLNEENDVYAKAQRLKRMAMDTYGENQITKKLVEDSPKDALSYYSPSNILDFAHPVQLTSSFFDTGSFRRPFAFNIEENNEVDLDSVTDFNIAPKEKQEKSWKDFLDEQYENETSVEFNQDNVNIIQHYHKVLLYYLLNHKNRNVLRYGLLMKYPLRSLFCKNVLILAKSKHEENPSIDTTINACVDTLLFVLKSIETYNMLGNMGSTSDVWGGVSEANAQALEYLYRHKMFDWDSSNISIKQFWDMLGHLHGVKRTQSRARFYELKKEGYVKSKSNGNETRVWLSYIPKEIQVKNTNFKPLEFWKKYIRCVGGYKALLTYLKELFVDDKTFEKERGVGSVGVVGAIIIKYIRRVEAQSKNKNKNILYELKNLRIGASADTPDTPNQINQNQANKSVNQENKGVDTPKNHPTHPEKTKQSKKKDKDIQFWEHPECEHIKPSCSKTDILQYIKQNSGVDSKKLYEKFGVGSLKFKNELLKEGRIKQNKLKLEVAKNE